ncbi:Dabb family protein [Cryobacterium frigoriphilum]|uniref:Dabb family protein n=1 Tax=Cryobacterium frigoriphilum TaxID=1259150 RepID=A0A4R9A968_9MICO|nr:Dabb family protein [Cryobacterium frigoriphilum]TFD54451.1 Dabb family protein [Cryobacterium frigoriphilum]
MIRHVVMFKFADTFTAPLQQQWLAGLDTLVGQVPGLRSLSVGRDVLGSERSWNVALVAEFDTLAQVAGYATHPLHLPLIALSGPNCDDIVSVDYEWPDHTEMETKR